MLKNNRGFLLPEFFLAIGTWLIIACFFIPAYIHLLQQMKAIEQDLTAHQLLYECLLKWRAEESVRPLTQTIEKENIVYKISWKDGKEACIEYVDVFKKTQAICEES
ncbi:MULTISPECIES: hypothetical protein [unclassified Niallia]|uniref:hypothetical protein n=1 Tax=unclassified Niallia TaxID=2837522 RepID=UPI001EDC66D2|nr:MULTISPECIES: hypothetical protein [unclassified Niallia]MDL0437444.1 hypothetical protein [Niallia sp. SS-2023]UPO86554.1 hypothetical protein L8T27_013240 [Niallia sp. Man26]